MYSCGNRLPNILTVHFVHKHPCSAQISGNYLDRQLGWCACAIKRPCDITDSPLQLIMRGLVSTETIAGNKFRLTDTGDRLKTNS